MSDEQAAAVLEIVEGPCLPDKTYLVTVFLPAARHLATLYHALERELAEAREERDVAANAQGPLVTEIERVNLLLIEAERKIVRLTKDDEHASMDLHHYEGRANRAESALAALREQHAEAEAALTSIATHPHISYDHPSNAFGGGSYGTGCADGHRCEANIAKAALERREP